MGETLNQPGRKASQQIGFPRPAQAAEGEFQAPPQVDLVPDLPFEGDALIGDAPAGALPGEDEALRQPLGLLCLPVGFEQVAVQVGGFPP